MSEHLSSSAPPRRPLLDGKLEGDVMEDAMKMDSEREWEERIRANSEAEHAAKVRRNEKIAEQMSHQDEVRSQRADTAKAVDSNTGGSKHEMEYKAKATIEDNKKLSEASTESERELIVAERDVENAKYQVLKASRETAKKEETLRDESRKKRIEDRRNSKDIARLNDLAALDIWGADGRTWIDNDGTMLVDKDGYEYERGPDGTKVRGKKYVGNIEEIRQDESRRKHRHEDSELSAGEIREMAADDYETTVLGLIEEGFEPCQALLIMDLREDDNESKPLMIAEFIKDGMSAVEAESRANQVYAKKDAARLKMIEEGGAFTHDEYRRVRRGEDLYPEPKKDGPELPPKPSPEPEPTPEPELPHPAEVARMVFTPDDCQELGNALTEYSQLLAKFEIKHSTRGSEVLETARRRFETQRTKMMGQLQVELELAGYDPKDIKAELDRQLVNYDPQSKKFGGDIALVEDATRIEAERFYQESKITEKLTRLWQRKDLRGILGKAGVMLPVGLVAGAAGGLLLGPVAGAAAATFFATRLAKGFAGSTLSARSRALTNARANAADRRKAQVNMIRQSNIQYKEGEIVVPDATSQFSVGGENSVRSNQKRAGVLIGAGLVAGGVGAVAADHLVDGVNAVTGIGGGVISGDVDINPFDGDGDSVPVPPIGEDDGDHFERTRFGELFKLDGDPNDPSRLQLVHEDQLDKASDLVTLRTADGNIIAEHMRIGPYGLRPEDLARIHEAGYEVNFTPDADSGAGRIEIFKTDLQEQE